MAEPKPDSLAPYLIKNAPPSMFYIPNFINPNEEEYILNKIPPNKWISLSHRRLQSLPARLTATNALVASTGFPDWLLQPVTERFVTLGIFEDSPHGGANHCLINEYHPGQGIMPHEDGAAYHPVVATVSLGGSLVLEVTEKADPNNSNDESASRKSWRILQEPRSLLVTTGSAYTDTLHGIAERKEDTELNEGMVANWELLSDECKESLGANGGRNERTTRISLTYRDVLKVSRISSKIFGKQKT